MPSSATITLKRLPQVLANPRGCFFALQVAEKRYFQRAAADRVDRSVEEEGGLMDHFGVLDVFETDFAAI